MVRTPISYYGGKQYITTWVLSNFPKNYHRMFYVEPFAGGLSVFFSKKPSEGETISDIDKDLFIFYKNLRDNPAELKRRIYATLYSENEHTYAKKILKNKTNYSEMEIAWATFLSINFSFSCMKNGSFGYSKGINCDGTTSPRTRVQKNKLLKFNWFSKRLKDCQIMNRPALDMIKRFDSEDALFYLDPPYPETDQSYQHQFTNNQWNEMIECLKTIKGKFLLSFYLKDWMSFPAKWKIIQKKSRNTTSINKEDRTNRVESLIKNF